MIVDILKFRTKDERPGRSILYGNAITFENPCVADAYARFAKLQGSGFQGQEFCPECYEGVGRDKDTGVSYVISMRRNGSGEQVACVLSNDYDTVFGIMGAIVQGLPLCQGVEDASGMLREQAIA